MTIRSLLRALSEGVAGADVYASILDFRGAAKVKA